MLQLIAHRGASKYAPENTMSAFMLAHQMGAHHIECDVILCADKVPIVIHDDDLGEQPMAEVRLGLPHSVTSKAWMLDHGLATNLQVLRF